MRILAATMLGAFAATIVGALLGVLPARRPRRPRSTPRAGTWLRQAGVDVSVAQYRLAVGVAIGCPLLALTALTGSVFVALVPSVAVAAAPRAFFARRRRRRLRAVQEAWPDGLRDVLASIGAGRSLTQALADLARHGPPALRVAFARFPELARVLGTPAALELVKDDLADPTTDRIVEVLLVADERGGAIVRTILEDLVAATTKDLKVADAIETEGLEMRINSRAVVVLPWIVLVALTARPGPFRDFYRTGGGALTLAVGAGLSVVGVVVLGRLARDRSEARVFAGNGSAA